ncbi:unnamed protein product [Nesidiocoris tenuis]|uniref:Uncharacterized protein n=1 Tax=Nesidiocoris tenuis TaxID=355587 RepID=A0A6H5HM17_9HEMI|nr:unnamed protein product [Nesidiocoris tenuis]
MRNLVDKGELFRIGVVFQGLNVYNSGRRPGAQVVQPESPVWFLLKEDAVIESRGHLQRTHEGTRKLPVLRQQNSLEPIDCESYIIRLFRQDVVN